MGTPDRVLSSRLSRRAVVGAGLSAFVVAAVPFARRSARRRFARTAPSMGTFAEIAVVHDDPRRANAAMDAAFAALRRIERRMTRHDAASDVGRANLARRSGPVDVSGETARVLAEALRWAEGSDGAFDPCLEKATELWDVEHRTSPPDAALVRRLAGRRLWRSLDVEVRGDRGTLVLGEADAALDLGGIAAGFGVDQAVEALRLHGVRDGLVNVGGDIFALGRSESGDPWRVGVRSPRAEDGLVAEVEVTDAAIATSGDYEKHFEHAGRRYHHILDPETAAPVATTVHGVTVVASTALEADAASTTVFGRPAAFAARVLGRLAPGVRIVATV